jgi:hypothetical protein
LLEVNHVAFLGNGKFGLPNTAGTKYRIVVSFHAAPNAAGGSSFQYASIYANTFSDRQIFLNTIYTEAATDSVFFGDSGSVSIDIWDFRVFNGWYVMQGNDDIYYQIYHNCYMYVGAVQKYCLLSSRDAGVQTGKHHPLNPKTALTPQSQPQLPQSPVPINKVCSGRFPTPTTAN